MPRDPAKYHAQMAEWVARQGPRTCACGRAFQPRAYSHTRCGHPDCHAPARQYRSTALRRVTSEEHDALTAATKVVRTKVPAAGGEPYHPNLNLAVRRVAFAQREGPAAYHQALVALIADCTIAAGQAAEVQGRPSYVARDGDELAAVA